MPAIPHPALSDKAPMAPLRAKAMGLQVKRSKALKAKGQTLGKGKKERPLDQGILLGSFLEGDWSHSEQRLSGSVGIGV